MKILVRFTSVGSDISYFHKQLAKALIRLHVCAGWSEILLVAHTILLEISRSSSFYIYVIMTECQGIRMYSLHSALCNSDSYKIGVFSPNIVTKSRLFG